MEDLAEQAFEKSLVEMGVPILEEGSVVKEKPAIGEGGFGKVYKATYKEHIVAVKKIKLDVESAEKKDVYAEISTEIKNILYADNADIPKFFGIWKNAKGYYHLVFEFIKGEPWRNCYESMDKKTKLQVLKDVCEILDQIHKKKLIHRDIKPENIMIEEGNKPKLIDLGVSKIASKTCTFTKVERGTTLYMAPEMFYDVDIDNASEKPVPVSTYSDIWSLGVTISQVFSGIKPWHKNKTHQLNDNYIISRLSNRAKFPIPNDLDDDVKELVERAANLDPFERPNAGDLKQIIQKMLGEEK